ncbi:hypothetical protein OAS39_12460 [Pirellulales bacterium]|nr:hypothetical protein [Pirellulales bacterium]
MSRIFAVLAGLSLALIVTAMGLGLMIGDLYDHPGPETLSMRRVHFLTGVAAALAVVLVESIIVTYFIGTSRWCKEVTETYRLDLRFLRESTRLKRGTFPLCVVGMLTAVGVGALGAASDPGTGRPNTAEMAGVHLGAALVGLCLIAWTYYRSWLNVAANQVVIDDVMGEVRRTRDERGLD